MEPYSILQASDITASPNNTSVRHICDQNQSNLPNVTSEWCEIAQFSVLQRGIKIQGFDQIQKIFRRNSHQSRKKNWGLGAL